MTRYALTESPFSVWFTPDMNVVIRTQRLKIRPVEARDLDYLLDWWNSGQIMKHVGFPQGLKVSLDELRRYYQKWKKDPLRMMKIVCLKSEVTSGDVSFTGPIGEANFHHYNIEEKSVEIGLKICIPELWNRGYGTEVLRAMTGYAFDELEVDRVQVNPAKTNERIIHVNEKVGFKTIGEKNGGLLMEMRKEDWVQ